MLRFAHPVFLFALLAIPVFTAIFLFMLYKKRKSIALYGDVKVLERLMPDYSQTRIIWKFIILMAAWASVCIGLADPQVGSKLEKIKRRGIDLVFALDVSNSMMAQDIAPNRLERAKQSISKLIDEFENDRIGLVIFAGKSYVQMPLTSDFIAAKLFLSTIKPDIIPVQGTAIGEALIRSGECFGASKQSKAIILITDGENHEDDAVSAAREAASNNIKVFTIGMGSQDGAPIPIMNGNVQVGYKKDREGNTVISRLNDQLLRDVAQAGNGAFVRATNSQVGVKSIFDQLNKMEKTEYSAKHFSDYEDRFQFFIFLGILLLFIDLLLFERKGILAGKIKLFEN